MRRRDFLTGVMLASLAFSNTKGQPPQAPQPSRFDADTIKAGLRTTDIEDQGFIEDSLTLVNQGVLPADLLDTTFIWARRKPRHRFQYFKRALIVRAAALNIPLEDLIAEIEATKPKRNATPQGTNINVKS
jgi:hypothetical protein